DVRATRAHEPVGRRGVGVVGALVAEMPAVELAPPLAEWILAALVGPSDETVERDRHVAGGIRHRRPLEGSSRLASGDSTLVQASTTSVPSSWPQVSRWEWAVFARDLGSADSVSGLRVPCRLRRPGTRATVVIALAC